MSRIGKQPVVIPANVKVSVKDQLVHIEGPKGSLDYKVPYGIKVKSEGDKVLVEKVADNRQTKADYGTTRANINNMVLGVTTGWKRSLELFGVGFNAKVAGQTLILAVGFSHEVKLEIPKAIKCAVTKTTIDLDSSDKELLGTFAAKIRKVQPPEPYLGKGIKFTEETVRRKAGKTGKK